MTFNEKMRELRIRKGVTQEKAAKGMKISLSALRNYENDRMADTRVLKMIKNYYQVSYEYLLEDDCVNMQPVKINQNKQLKLEDKTIENIEKINENNQNNILNNLIQNISRENFWSKLDEFLGTEKEIKILKNIKNSIKYQNLLIKYATNKDLLHFSKDLEGIELNASFLEQALEIFCKENKCTYAIEDMEKILKDIEFLFQITKLKQLSHMERENIPYYYCISIIATCIKKNAYIPKKYIDILLKAIDYEIKEREDKKEVIEFNLSKELSNYLTLIADHAK